jgi:hypothetical protein
MGANTMKMGYVVITPEYRDGFAFQRYLSNDGQIVPRFRDARVFKMRDEAQGQADKRSYAYVMAVGLGDDARPNSFL